MWRADTGPGIGFGMLFLSPPDPSGLAGPALRPHADYTAAGRVAANETSVTGGETQ